MKTNFILIVLFIAFSYSLSHGQHLPLQIGNQWHYDMTIMAPGIHYAAIVVDTVVINGYNYYKIERRHYQTGELLEITYDRLEGDSLYYRIRNGEEKLIFNFNWPNGHVEIIPNISGFYINIIYVGWGSFWGFYTQFYSIQHGEYYNGSPDTLWLLFHSTLTRKFGCTWAGDGQLKGAIIDGITYGSLYPLPVELSYFDAEVSNNAVHLYWQTSSELNNRGYEIQRIKGDDEKWCSIAFIEGRGTTTEKSNYRFIDHMVTPGFYIYRIIQIDFDGSTTQISIKEVNISPSVNELYLSQNYPNPFNPITQINFDIPQESHVSLKIFDALGNEVGILISEIKKAGQYKIYFDGSTLSSGNYFYSLTSSDGRIIKRMLLLK